MEDGVVHVYANKDCKIFPLKLGTSDLHCLLSNCTSFSFFPAQEKLFPVADATTFFTDLHHILKVIAAGNIRTLCHHRLVLLEQVGAPSILSTAFAHLFIFK